MYNAKYAAPCRIAHECTQGQSFNEPVMADPNITVYDQALGDLPVLEDETLYACRPDNASAIDMNQRGCTAYAGDTRYCKGQSRETWYRFPYIAGVCDFSVYAWQGCTHTVAEKCPTTLQATCSEASPPLVSPDECLLKCEPDSTVADWSGVGCAAYVGDTRYCKDGSREMWNRFPYVADICDASVFAWQGCNHTVAEMCPTSLQKTCNDAIPPLASPNNCVPPCEPDSSDADWYGIGCAAYIGDTRYCAGESRELWNRFPYVAGICDASVFAWQGCNQTVAEMCPTSLTATCTAVGKRIPGFECYTSPP